MTKKKLKGLVISWFYPPGNSSEGLVTYKLLKNSAFEYDVFTRKNFKKKDEGDIWDRNVVEEELVSDNVKIHFSSSEKSKDFIAEAVAFFEKHKDEYDFVMSRIMPAEAHEAAILIKEAHPEIFWIASFGDPLIDTPYISEIKKHENPFSITQYIDREHPSSPRLARIFVSPTRRARKRVWEKDRIEGNRMATTYRQINTSTFAKADLLIFNNPYQLEHAFSGENKGFREKGTIVNHSFDLSLYKKPKKVQSKKVRFLYVGHLDAMRNAKALLEAIHLLSQGDSSLVTRAHFDFYGHMDDSDKAKIVDYSLHNIVSVHGNINYLESLQKISETDWLVLIDTNLNSELDEYLFFPAKLADYLAVKKNILAITQLKGATADIIRKVGAGQIVTHSASDIMLYLSKIIYQSYSPAKYNEQAWREYDAKVIAEKFDDLVRGRIKK